MTVPRRQVFVTSRLVGRGSPYVDAFIFQDTQYIMPFATTIPSQQSKVAHVTSCYVVA